MMDSLFSLFIPGFFVLAVFLLFKLVRANIRIIFKLLLHALGGFVTLFFVNFFGSYFNISLELSWLNAIITGVLGIPGVGLLLVLRYLL